MAGTHKKLHRPKCTADPNAEVPLFGLQLDRDTYYDRDRIEGKLLTSAGTETLYRNVKVVLSCCLHVDEKWNHGIVYLHRSHRLLGAHFVVTEGEHEHPFSISVPSANHPASFDGDLRKITWLVKVTAHTVCCGNKVELASAPFQRGTLYLPQLQLCPAAATEAAMFRSKGKVRLDAQLDKSLYTAGEPVSVRVSVNNQTRLQCTRVTVGCVQVVEYDLKTVMYYKKAVLLDRAARDCVVPPGELRETSLVLMPQVDTVPKGARVGVMPAPTTQAVLAQKTFSLSVRYYMEVTCSFGLFRQVTLRLPFTMQSPYGSDQHATGDVPFETVLLDNYLSRPPRYEQLQAQSTPFEISSPALHKHAKAHTDPHCPDCQQYARTFSMHVAGALPIDAPNGDEREETIGPVQRKGSLRTIRNVFAGSFSRVRSASTSA